MEYITLHYELQDKIYGCLHEFTKHRRHINTMSEKSEGGNFVKAYIEERAVEVANFIITSNATVRETAKRFGISKSTVHMVFPFRVGAIM